MTAFARLKRLWADPPQRRDSDTLDRVERILESLAAARSAFTEPGPDDIQGRVKRLEQRLGALERRQEALQVEMRDRFESVNDRFRTLTSQLEHLEGRVVAQLDRLQGNISILAMPVAHLGKRLEQIESASDQMNARVDTLRCALRQRPHLSSSG